MRCFLFGMAILSHRGRSLVVLGGSVVIAAGLYMTGRDVSEWREANDSLSWKGVEARITESAAIRVSGGAKSGSGHQIRIRYRYAVAGRTFEGHRINVGNHLDDDVRRDIATLHPVGSAVTVYHHPADPSRSVLETGPVFALPWVFFPGGVLVAVAGFFVFAAVTDRLQVPSGNL